MSSEDLKILVDKYLELDKEAKELQLKIEVTKNFIKREMESRNVEKLKVSGHIVTYKDVLTSVFDKTRFKEKYEELYAMFITQRPSKLFKIS